jgi:hypothetical protein
MSPVLEAVTWGKLRVTPVRGRLAPPYFLTLIEFNMAPSKQVARE